MLCMTGDDVGRCTCCHRVIVRSTHPTPRREIKVPKQHNGRTPNSLKLFGDVAHWEFCIMRVPRPSILIEPRQSCSIVARKHYSAICEDPLRIGDVPDEFFVTPFAGLVTEICKLLVDAAE